MVTGWLTMGSPVALNPGGNPWLPEADDFCEAPPANTREAVNNSPRVNPKIFFMFFSLSQNNFL
jgi:hypothetical protein